MALTYGQLAISESRLEYFDLKRHPEYAHSMTGSTFKATLRNAARGQQRYRDARHRIFQSVRERSVSDDKDLGVFLRDKLFKLRKREWFALAFDDKDWRSLDQIRADSSGLFDTIYLRLALDYIAANRSRVLEMYGHQSSIGTALLRDDADAVQAVIEVIDDDDRQSLFVFRVVSAQYSYSGEQLETYFRHNLKTDWLHKRFLYPLIYHAINSPVEANLENFLSYIVTGHERESEKAAIKFLLRDDVAKSERLGFKAYVALLCHPFDACEILLNHIELVLSTGYSVSDELRNALIELASAIPASRVLTLLRFSLGNPPSFSPSLRSGDLVEVHGFAPDIAEFFGKFATVDVDPQWSDGGLSKLLGALKRLRCRKYPIPDDFDYLTTSGRSWWFCEGGRILNALVTSLYMVPRKERIYEVRDLFRLSGFFGNILPFFLTAPSGGAFLEQKFSPLLIGTTVGEMEAATDAVIESPGIYQDRMWIKAVQWELRDAESKMHLSKWLQTVRSEIRIAPAFLTGIDWSWVVTVIKHLRLRPFIGNSSGLYALLLQRIEERDQRSEALRVAVEPFVAGRTLEEFIEWLIQEYNIEAIAFARFLLDPDTILLLGLAPNKMAALAARIYALQRCTRQFNYTELLPQSLFAQEWETLNSTLLLLSVNAGQFEIPWSVFERDAAAKQLDLYTTAHTLQPADDASPILTEAKMTVPYRFRNGKVVVYNYTNRLAPIASLVIGIVEDFLEHPGFGLEVVLSTRFRHDTMRREFANVLMNVAEADIPSVLPMARRAIVEEVEKALLDEVDHWLDQFMHTNRPGRPHGLFNVVPNQQEMTAILGQLNPRDGLHSIISSVATWVRERLEQQLPNAQAQFTSEVSAALSRRVLSEKDRLLDSQEFRDSDVERVLSAIGTSLQRRVEELEDWFRAQAGSSRMPLPFGDVKMAADGLFEAFKQRRKYRSYFGAPTAINRTIASDKVRLCFDLLREIFASAIQHSRPQAARIRISAFSSAQGQGFRFSNLASSMRKEAREVSGHPYTSLDDVIFREGDSGLAKIASLSASIVGSATNVTIHERAGSFHLDVVLWNGSPH